MTATDPAIRPGSSTGADTGPRDPRFLRVARYHALVYRQLWRGSVLTTIIGPILYLVAMGVGVGSLIDDRDTTPLDMPYIEFVAPGLLAAGAMQMAMAQALYPVLGSVKWERTAFGLAATPLRPIDQAVGLQVWLALHMAAAATVFLAVAAVAGAVGSPWGLLAPLVAALGGLAYSTWAAAWAMTCTSEQSFQPILRLGILPSFLLSGTFFEVSQLPAVLELLARITPLWHSVTLVRGLAGGSIELLAAAGHLAVLVAYAAAGLAVAARAYRKRLNG